MERSSTFWRVLTDGSGSAGSGQVLRILAACALGEGVGWLFKGNEHAAGYCRLELLGEKADFTTRQIHENDVQHAEIVPDGAVDHKLTGSEMQARVERSKAGSQVAGDSGVEGRKCH